MAPGNVAVARGFPQRYIRAQSTQQSYTLLRRPSRGVRVPERSVTGGAHFLPSHLRGPNRRFQKKVRAKNEVPLLEPTIFGGRDRPILVAWASGTTDARADTFSGKLLLEIPTYAINPSKKEEEKTTSAFVARALVLLTLLRTPSGRLRSRRVGGLKWPGECPLRSNVPKGTFRRKS